MNELDAIELEANLIATLPNLTNIDPRGVPTAGRFDLRRWLQMVETWPNGPTFPGMYNGHIHAHNFVVQVRRLLAEKDSTETNVEGRGETGGWKTGLVIGISARESSRPPRHRSRSALLRKPCRARSRATRTPF